jgi:hypothetical protein
MEILDAEVMVTGPIYDFKADLRIKEGCDYIEVIDNCTFVNM